MKNKSFYFICIFFLVAVDQLTKTIVNRSMGLYSSIKVIPGFLNLTYIRNKGAIFGFFSWPGNSLVYVFLTLTSFLALSLVIYYFFKTPSSEKLMKISLSLILAGALGNLIDRVFRGYVIDFVDCYIKKWHWPFFNVADSCITIGALFLIYIFLFKKGPKCSQY